MPREAVPSDILHPLLPPGGQQFHRTNTKVPSDDSTDRTIRQFSINWRFIAPTLKRDAMTQQVAHILKTLRETTAIQPKQCSAYPEISNAHPAVSSSVLRERHLAVNDAPLSHDLAETAQLDIHR